MADIIETAKQAGNLNTFLSMVQTAKLTNTLRGVGPYTVFAPTDEAFEKLPFGSVQNLMNDINMLREVLLYHIVPGEYLVDDIVDEDELETVEGQNIVVDSSDGLMVNNATVTQTDIEADNGIIQVIDAVILPKVGVNLQ